MSEIAGLNPTPTLAFKFQRNKMCVPRSLVKIQYCGGPLWLSCSVLSLRPPRLESRLKPHSFHLIYHHRICWYRTTTGLFQMIPNMPNEWLTLQDVSFCLVWRVLFCGRIPAKTTRWPNAGLMFATVYDAGPTLARHWVNVSCLLGCLIRGQDSIVRRIWSRHGRYCRRYVWFINNKYITHSINDKPWSSAHWAHDFAPTLSQRHRCRFNIGVRPCARWDRAVLLWMLYV